MTIDVFQLIIIFFSLLIIFILTLISNSLIIHDTSKGNVLNLEEDNDKLYYFKIDIINVNFNSNGNCKCGENILTDYCSEELLKLGCININLNKKMRNLSNFKNKCNEVRNKIINENIKLKDIFKLKTNSIKSTSNALLAFNILIFLFSALYIFILYDTWEKKNDEIFCSCFGTMIYSFFYYIINLIFLIIDIALFSSACQKFNSDDSKNFVKFLECPNINKDGFSKYSILQNLPTHFILFKIFQTFFILFILAFPLYLMYFYIKDNGKEESLKEKTALKTNNTEILINY